MELFKKNIDALRRNNTCLAKRLVNGNNSPYIQIIISHTGDPVPFFHNNLLHSRYDPVKEAEQWALSNLSSVLHDEPLVVLGFGFGYHIKSIIRHGSNHVSVIESSIDLFNKAVESVDITDILERVSIYIKPLSYDLRIPRCARLLIHRPSLNIDTFFYSKLYRIQGEEALLHPSLVSVAIDELMSEAGKESTLGSYLQGFKNDGLETISLYQIFQSISGKKSDAFEGVENIFRIIHELF